MSHPRNATPRLWIGLVTLLSLTLLLSACVQGSTTLQAPTDVTATPSGSGYITITWDATDNGQTGFEVQRAEQPTPAAITPTQDLEYEVIATLGPTARQYVDNDVMPGILYYYAVTAIYPNGTSDPATPEGGGGTSVENQPPIAYDVEATTDQGTPVDIVLAAEDPEGKPLAFEILSGPNHGTLTGTGIARIYTPNTGFSGEDTLTFQANDGANTSNTATVTITVNPTSNPPTILKTDRTPYADGETATIDVDAGASTQLDLEATDPDPVLFLPQFFWVIDTPPTTGTATINEEGIVTYTADTGPTRDDTFIVRVYDQDPTLYNTALYDELTIEVVITGTTGTTIGSFTPCGATGRLGPTQGDCDTAYLGTDLEGKVTVTNGIQTITIAQTGTYRIVAEGAQGAAADPNYEGGRGVRMHADFNLTAGDTIQIVVGQVGEGENSGSNGSGGGGSFVVDVNDNPLLIAGGGGGARMYSTQNGCDANTGEYGIAGSGGSSSSTCTPKTTDLGEGGAVSSASWGSGGAGFYSDGEGDSTNGNGGYSWANGMTGGEGVSTSAGGAIVDGGFGGGGSGNGSWGGGGGGGYSGGDGGYVAGGGGSFVAPSGTSIVTTPAGPGIGEGDGFVTITLIGTP